MRVKPSLVAVGPGNEPITSVYLANRDLSLALRFARHARPITTIIYTRPSDEGEGIEPVELHYAIMGRAATSGQRDRIPCRLTAAEGSRGPPR